MRSVPEVVPALASRTWLRARLCEAAAAAVAVAAAAAASASAANAAGSDREGWHAVQGGKLLWQLPTDTAGAAPSIVTIPHNPRDSSLSPDRPVLTSPLPSALCRLSRPAAAATLSQRAPALRRLLRPLGMHLRVGQADVPRPPPLQAGSAGRQRRAGH